MTEKELIEYALAEWPAESQVAILKELKSSDPPSSSSYDGWGEHLLDVFDDLWGGLDLSQRLIAYLAAQELSLRNSE